MSQYDTGYPNHRIEALKTSLRQYTLQFINKKVTNNNNTSTNDLIHHEVMKKNGLDDPQDR